MEPPVRPSASIHLKTLIVLGVVLDLPVVARLVRGMTPEPRVENTELGGVPGSLVRPSGRGPWPAILFVNGAHPLRRREPVVERVAHGLARAGFLVIVPDLPGLGLGEITTRTLDAAAGVAREAADLDAVRGGRIALIGASTGASIAILLAARPDLAGRVSLVSSVTPYADMRKIICLATTERYECPGGYRSFGVTNLLRRAIARSMTVTIPACEERERLLDSVGSILEQDDPFARIRPSQEWGPGAVRAIVRLLENREAARFAELFGDLPADLRAMIAEMSPLTVAAAVQAPVEMAVPPLDRYFPVEEAQVLARALPRGRLTVTGALDHTRPGFSLRRLGEYSAFRGYVVRTLAGASS
jgi:pimeloyl-ACP methyl ester carboxylesterase